MCGILASLGEWAPHWLDVCVGFLLVCMFVGLVRSQPNPMFVLQFALTIIGWSGRAAKSNSNRLCLNLFVVKLCPPSYTHLMSLTRLMFPGLPRCFFATLLFLYIIVKTNQRKQGAVGLHGNEAVFVRLYSEIPALFIVIYWQWQRMSHSALPYNALHSTVMCVCVCVCVCVSG